MLEKKDLIKLAGLIFGDGYIHKSGRIGFKHSIIQKDYVDFKTEYAINNFDMKFSFYIQEKITGYSTNPNYEALSRVKHYLKNLRKLWYDGNSKNIPIEIIKEFSWEQWAFIYQDDGRENKNNYYKTTVNGIRTKTKTSPFVNRYEIFLGNKENNYCKAIQDNLLLLGINSTLVDITSKSKKIQKVIRITQKKSKDLFYSKLKPLIHNSMKYKLSALPSLSYNHSERLNEETTYKCEICNKEKEDHEMCIITDVDLISKQYVCQNCLNGIK